MSSSLMIPLVILSLLFLAVFIILFIAGLNKREQEEQVKDIISTLSESENTYSVQMNQFEHYLVSKFNIPMGRVRFFVYLLRFLGICVAIASYLYCGAFGLAIWIAGAILIIMESKKKDEIEKSGVTRIANTVAFMDHFVPQISSGASASQAFITYIQKLDEDNEYRDLLIDYWNAKKDENYVYETPNKIKDIVSVYECAAYNEEIGSTNYLGIIEESKTDLFQKSVYYADYCSKVGEVLKPIEAAYYFGVPIIIFLLLGTVGDFWFTFPGWCVALALSVLFFLFKFLCNKLAIDTLREIV